MNTANPLFRAIDEMAIPLLQLDAQLNILATYVMLEEAAAEFTNVSIYQALEIIYRLKAQQAELIELCRAAMPMPTPTAPEPERVRKVA